MGNGSGSGQETWYRVMIKVIRVANRRVVFNRSSLSSLKEELDAIFAARVSGSQEVLFNHEGDSRGHKGRGILVIVLIPMNPEHRGGSNRGYEGVKDNAIQCVSFKWRSVQSCCPSMMT